MPASKSTGHIAEVQITLVPLMQIKSSGGHAAYQLARLLALNDRQIYRHEGALSDVALEQLRCGVVRELVCRGTASGLAAHFDRLLVALRSPSCGLSELKLVGCDWPEGRTLSELVEALPATGLKTLAVAEMKVGVELPEAVGDKCAGAEFVALDSLRLTGGVPASLGKCTKLKKLFLYENQLEGPIPDELGQCGALEWLQLQKNQLTGGVPASLGKCAKLKKLLLWGNQLEGAVPATELAELTALEYLDLEDNQGLTITASGVQVLKEALPSAKLFLPTEVAG